MGCTCVKDLKEQMNEVQIVTVEHNQEIDVRDIQEIMEVSEREENDGDKPSNHISPEQI